MSCLLCSSSACRRNPQVPFPIFKQTIFSPYRSALASLYSNDAFLCQPRHASPNSLAGFHLRGFHLKGPWQRQWVPPACLHANSRRSIAEFNRLLSARSDSSIESNPQGCWWRITPVVEITSLRVAYLAKSKSLFPITMLGHSRLRRRCRSDLTPSGGHVSAGTRAHSLSHRRFREQLRQSS